jgi:putative beta-lysine N-acetyltransferase
MVDIIETFQKIPIQHGPHNSRIYLMKLYEANAPDIIQDLDKLAQEKEYGKILAKVPRGLSSFFQQRGYLEEATIPGFSREGEDVLFMAKYFSKERRLEKHQDRINKILAVAQTKKTGGNRNYWENRSMIRKCTSSDAGEMSSVYKKVFKTYPFPIHNPEYLSDTMRSHVHYFCICEGKAIVALASSEVDIENLSVEMMDFATLTDRRGQGFACRLFSQMEGEMKCLGMRTAYTISRALSPGMNITCSKMGYNYAGTLKNNCNISGSIQSMNVWYKTL